MNNPLFLKPDKLEQYIRRCYSVAADKYKLIIGYNIVVSTAIKFIKGLSFAAVLWFLRDWIIQGIMKNNTQNTIPAISGDWVLIFIATWGLIMIQGLVFRISSMALLSLQDIKSGKKLTNLDLINIFRLVGFIFAALSAYLIINTFSFSNFGLGICVGALIFDGILIMIADAVERLYKTIDELSRKAETFSLSAGMLTEIKKSGKYSDESEGFSMILEFKEDGAVSDNKGIH